MSNGTSHWGQSGGGFKIISSEALHGLFGYVHNSL